MVPAKAVDWSSLSRPPPAKPMVLEPTVPPVMTSIRPPLRNRAPDRCPPDQTTSTPPEDTFVPVALPNT